MSAVTVPLHLYTAPTVVRFFRADPIADCYSDFPYDLCAPFEGGICGNPVTHCVSYLDHELSYQEQREDLMGWIYRKQRHVCEDCLPDNCRRQVERERAEQAERDSDEW